MSRRQVSGRQVSGRQDVSTRQMRKEITKKINFYSKKIGWISPIM